MKFSEAYELDFGIKIENSSYDFIINNSENSIVIDSKIAHSSMLGNIVKASLHIVTIGSRWIKNNTKIYSLVILFWYLIIFTIPFIFLYPKNNSPIWIINLLLFTITIINFIEINIKSKFKKLVLFELLHLEIIDELELSITKKLLNSWQFSNLNYSFTPLKDIYNFLRFNKNRP